MNWQHLDFETYYQLHLNIPRQLTRQAIVQANGNRMSANLNPLPDSVFDALTVEEEEREELKFKVNANRYEARVMKRMSSGGPPF